MSWWPAIVFGWPAILLALLLAVLAIIKNRPSVLVVAAVIAAPFSLYLAGTPRIGWYGLMIPLLLVGANIAVRHRRVVAAWLLLAPIVAVIGWVGSLVIMQ